MGAILRYLLSTLVNENLDGAFPLGTLLVNVLGSFLIGVVWVSAENGNLSPTLTAFIITGVLGALTTFSTYALDTLRLIEGGLTPLAILYLITSNALGLTAAYFGILLNR